MDSTLGAFLQLAIGPPGSNDLVDCLVFDPGKVFRDPNSQARYSDFFSGNGMFRVFTLYTSDPPEHIVDQFATTHRLVRQQGKIAGVMAFFRTEDWYLPLLYGNLINTKFNQSPAYP